MTMTACSGGCTPALQEAGGLQKDLWRMKSPCTDNTFDIRPLLLNAPPPRRTRLKRSELRHYISNLPPHLGALDVLEAI